MGELAAKRCVPCEGGTEALDRPAAEKLISQLSSDWALSEKGDEIHRDFRFKGFYKTIAFVNALAWIANQENHHPDMEVGYNHCLVRFSTHAIGGLSENDFICAAKTDALLDTT